MDYLNGCFKRIAIYMYKSMRAPPMYIIHFIMTIKYILIYEYTYICKHAYINIDIHVYIYCTTKFRSKCQPAMRGGGLGSRPIFKKFHETYAPS